MSWHQRVSRGLIRFLRAAAELSDPPEHERGIGV